jgi:hypothetical protein
VAADTLGEEAMQSEPALARAYAVALDRAGKLDQAGGIARSLLHEHGDDPELDAIVERMNARLPDPRTRGHDPFFTVQRAEAYLECGRIDLALRTYRRILAAHPGDQAVHARLLRLRAMPRESRPWVDDLSEEYWVSRPMSALSMPVPTLVPELLPAPDEMATVPGPPQRDAGPNRAAPNRMGDPPAGQGPALRAQPPRVRAPDGVGMLDTFDDDEEATTIMREDELQAAMRHSEDVDEEATVMMDPAGRRRLDRRMPGVDDLRRAIREDAEVPSEDDDAFSGSGDADDIIEQARAIERAAARRRSIFRK